MIQKRGRGVLIGAGLSLALMAIEVRAQEQTLQGEIVDPATYLKDGRHGIEMEEWTYEAVDGGQTLALLDTATNMLYVFLAEEPGEDPNELAYDYVNQQVTVEGTVYERGGLRGVVATSIQPLEPPERLMIPLEGLAAPEVPPAPTTNTSTPPAEPPTTPPTSD